MDPILREIPTRIETERLILRMPEPNDGKVVNAAIRASVNELKPWLPFVQTLPTVDETETNTRQAHAKFLMRTNLRYLIFHKDSGDFIGSTGFHNIDWEVPKLEVGYWIDTRFNGQGYITEAVGKLTEFALEDLQVRRVEIQCDSRNVKSRSIPEKLGYTLEGILRNDELSMDGKSLTDTCIYAKIK